MGRLLGSSMFATLACCFVTMWIRNTLFAATPVRRCTARRQQTLIAKGLSCNRVLRGKALRAVLEPPTSVAPPEVSDDVATSKDEWAECLVQFADTPKAADAQEVWVFRKGDFEEFQRLIGLRLTYRSDEIEGPLRFGAARREQAEAGTKVSCRDRSVDPELVCAECIRVFTGGAYKDKAISVPAFPDQPTVMGCLALSVGNSTDVVDDDPSNPLRQTAFCNTVNARFSTVDV
eukprot:TRINITY_DN94213_c0_g1_i1.p1 TRINITY_DN94213_c0_g1~~TRINITY_DN94213_c0_g1_i1.p1  ORF type:complete len:233 (-),score=41.87 TRINITY_DN94213_c0_g1_i1:221-919(-)